MANSEKIVPWEDHYIIGQGFVSPANTPVKGYANAFTSVPLGTDLDQATPGSDKIQKTILTKNEFSWTVAESYRDMASAIAASASFGVKGFGYSGSGTVESSTRTSVTEQSIVGILSTRFETHSFMLKELPDLSDAALDVIAAQGAEGFYKVFGTDFIAGQRLGGSFMGIIDVRLQNSAQKSDFSASVKGSYKFAAAKVSGAAAFKSAIENFQGTKDVKVKWVAKGWDAKAAPTFGGDENPETLLAAASTFCNLHSGVPVAAVLRPFTSHPQFVDAVFKRQGPVLSLPNSVKESILRSIQLEAIRINILSSTLAEFSNASTDATAKEFFATRKHQLEAAKITMARLEADPRRLNDIAVYMEHRPYDDNLTADLTDDKIPVSVLEEEQYEVDLQLEQAKARLTAAAARNSIAAKRKLAAPPTKPPSDTKQSNDQNTESNNQGEAPALDAETQQFMYEQAEKDAAAKVDDLEVKKKGLGFVASYKRGRYLFKAAFISERVGPEILARTNTLKADLPTILDGLTTDKTFAIMSAAFGTYFDMNPNQKAVKSSVVNGAAKFNKDDRGQIWSMIPLSSPTDPLAREVAISPAGLSIYPLEQAEVAGAKKIFLSMLPIQDGKRVTANAVITDNERWILEVLTGSNAGYVALKNKATGWYAALSAVPQDSNYANYVVQAHGNSIGQYEPLQLVFL